MIFKSQICTTIVQSERLLALGLKAITADMRYILFDGDLEPSIRALPWKSICKPCQNNLPAWSLHRLIEMLNYQVIHNGKKYEPVIAIDGMAYQDVCSDDPIVGWSGDLYTDVIDCIKWLISIEQFNTEYLEE